jgi:1-deoxy-D-xylulose-5-phosphate reductoisomerase
MKKILILGSSGSIGINSLSVIRNFPDQFRVEGLTVNSNIFLLEKQINEFKPSAVVVKDDLKAKELKKKFGHNCKVFSGQEGLIKAAANLDYDILINAIVGFAGLLPTIEAIKKGKRIALANKETLVVAGQLITDLCKEYGAEIIPVDSEHSAIFQCLAGEQNTHINKLILTASGGPFLNKDKNFLSTASIKEALNHPNWKMGNKITIDSASMMNKGLEVIEAHWLFGLSKERIEVIIHPQSIIHSMVEFIDGSIKAQLSIPDMKLPIQYALTFPQRYHEMSSKTDLTKIGTLTFFKPDFEKFECLKLAYDALTSGGTAPCILNAANEVAVDKFLQGNIKFSRIPVIIKKALNKIVNHTKADFGTIFECDKLTREFAAGLN